MHSPHEGPRARIPSQEVRSSLSGCGAQPLSPCRMTFLDGQLAEERRKVDLKVLDKYREKKLDLDKKQADLREVTDRRNAARGEHDELRKKRLEEFMHGFGIISTKLQEIYQMITIGGDAELNVVDSLDPFSEVCCMCRVLCWVEQEQDPHALCVCPSCTSSAALFPLGSCEACGLILWCCQSHPSAGDCVRSSTAEEELEEHQKSLWWRKDTEFTGTCLRAASLQAHTAVFYG